jgi:CheY-like chemotaxis protein
MSMDFASTGHLTITSLHTTNATTALFRFERLGVTRDVMAEAVLAVVAQRLIKRLCPECREVVPISDEERAWLEPFTDDIPEKVAHPKGCPACSGTGYAGREAVNEILEFDPQVQTLVRDGAPVPAIREFCRRRGDYMMYDHAIAKVRTFMFSPKDIQEKVLVEEAILSPDDAGADEGFYEATSAEDTMGGTAATAPASPAAAVLPVAPVRPTVPEPSAPVPATGPDREFSLTPQVLVVDDDPDIRDLVGTILRRGGFDVVTASDGGDALLELGRNCFDVVIADLVMPGLTGFKMLQIMSAQGMDAPVIFLTASDTDTDEALGFELGAVDFMHKPVRADVLLARVRRATAPSVGTAGQLVGTHHS